MRVVKIFSEIGEEIMQTLKTRHVTAKLAAVAYTLLVTVSMAFTAAANI